MFINVWSVLSSTQWYLSPTPVYSANISSARVALRHSRRSCSSVAKSVLGALPARTRTCMHECICTFKCVVRVRACKSVRGDVWACRHCRHGWGGRAGLLGRWGGIAGEVGRGCWGGRAGLLGCVDKSPWATAAPTMCHNSPGWPEQALL